MDYEEWEEQCEIQREKNNKLLDEFAEWLKEVKNLSDKTIREHVNNIDFYINECLLYEEVDTPEVGIWTIGYFLGYWFIRKAAWVSERQIKRNCASFKKFYKFMVEKGLVEMEDYQEMLDTIKEKKEEWLATMRRYDNPNIQDMNEVWGLDDYF